MAAGNVEDRCRAYGEGFEPGYPVEGEFDVVDGGVGAFLGALSDGGSSGVDPRLIAGSEMGGVGGGREEWERCGYPNTRGGPRDVRGRCGTRVVDCR